MGRFMKASLENFLKESTEDFLKEKSVFKEFTTLEGILGRIYKRVLIFLSSQFMDESLGKFRDIHE